MSTYMDYDPEGSRYTIRSQIAECNPEMLPRELVINAFEAGATKVEWAMDGNDLICLDNGDGIPESHFSQMLKFSAMTGKDRGVTGNKGIGARLTGLKNSPDGVTYTSGNCETKLMIGQDGFAQISESKGGDTVAKNPVPILGTKVSLSGGADVKALGWDMRKPTAIARALYQRLYSLDKGQQIKISSTLQAGNLGSQFETISETIKKGGWKQETVVAESGVKVTFVDAREWRRCNRSRVIPEFNVPCVGTHRTLSAIVYKREMYAVACKATEKTSFFNRIGMPEMADDLMIFISLPEDYGFLSNSDRTQLLWPNADKERGVSKSGSSVRPVHFLEEITKLRPAWVQEMLDNKKRKVGADALEKERKKLRSMIRDIFSPTPTLVQDEKGSESGGEDGPDVDVRPKTDNPVTPDNPPKPYDPRKKLKIGKKQRAKILQGLISGISIEMGDGMDTPCHINSTSYLVKINSSHRFISHYRDLLQSEFPDIEVAEMFDERLLINAQVPVGIAAVDALMSHLYEDDGKKQDCWMEWPTGALFGCAADTYEYLEKQLQKKVA